MLRGSLEPAVQKGAHDLSLIGGPLNDGVRKLGERWEEADYSGKKVLWYGTKGFLKSVVRVTVDYVTTGPYIQKVLNYAVSKGLPGAANVAGKFAKFGVGITFAPDVVVLICEWGIPYDTRFNLDSARTRGAT